MGYRQKLFRINVWNDTGANNKSEDIDKFVKIVR